MEIVKVKITGNFAIFKMITSNLSLCFVGGGIADFFFIIM